MTEKALPALVDVSPAKGRRIRTQGGSLLPEGHVLRGEPRSAYWLRLQRDRDVELSAHQPAVEAKPAESDPPTPGKLKG